MMFLDTSSYTKLTDEEWEERNERMASMVENMRRMLDDMHACNVSAISLPVMGDKIADAKPCAVKEKKSGKLRKPRNKTKNLLRYRCNR